MKVIAFNGSPHMDGGNTALILQPFLEGMMEVGANVDLFCTRKLNIGPCNGDLSCWFVNPGVCGQKDDMQMLLPLIKEADVVVWASPVYYAGITAPLKNLMDRQLPLYLQGRQTTAQKAVLVSTCGAWELSMFDPLLSQMKAIYTRPDGGSDFVGALLRPMADGMKEMIKAGETAMPEKIFQAAREAGRMLVKEGIISQDLQQQVSRELMPRDAYYRAMRAMMEQAGKLKGPQL